MSFNLEKLILVNQYIMFAFQGGLGFMAEMDQKNHKARLFLTAPVHLTMNIGKKRNFAELGLGGTFTGTLKEEKGMVYPIVGYRIQPLDSERFNFRIYGCFAVPGWLADGYPFSPIGMSIGVCF